MGKQPLTWIQLQTVFSNPDHCRLHAPGQDVQKICPTARDGNNWMHFGSWGSSSKELPTLFPKSQVPKSVLMMPYPLPSGYLSQKFHIDVEEQGKRLYLSSSAHCRCPWDCLSRLTITDLKYTVRKEWNCRTTISVPSRWSNKLPLTIVIQSHQSFNRIRLSSQSSRFCWASTSRILHWLQCWLMLLGAVITNIWKATNLFSWFRICFSHITFPHRSSSIL